MSKSILAASGLIALFLSTFSATAHAIPCSPADKDRLPQSLSGSASVYGQRVSIDVKIPDVEHITRCGVDALEFGDNIHFTFSKEFPVIATISSVSPVGLRKISRELKFTAISLESTILAEEREIYPYHVRINDRATGLVFDLYLDRSNRVGFTRAHYKGFGR